MQAHHYKRNYSFTPQQITSGGEGLGLKTVNDFVAILPTAVSFVAVDEAILRMSKKWDLSGWWKSVSS
jgi:hypothetical protein